MIRPKRFVYETCPTCHRPDWNHEDRYVLLTEEEYYATKTEFKLEVEGLPNNYEPVYPLCGSINEAVREAIQYCKWKDRVNIYTKRSVGVGFTFNGQLVTVTSKSVADEVIRCWWKQVYHETPEQTIARR